LTRNIPTRATPTGWIRAPPGGLTMIATIPAETAGKAILEAVKQHLPAGADWIPLVGLAALGLLGLVIVIKGARLLPAISALVMGGVGAGLGSLLQALPGAPAWLGIAAGAVVGMLVGVLFFRVWLSVLVAACSIIVSLGAYTLGFLGDVLNKFNSPQIGQVQMPSADGHEIIPTTPTPAAVWEHLGKAGYQPNIITILFAAGLAGLVLGLLLPKLARSFWAATFGTVLLLATAYSLFAERWAAQVPWFEHWGLVFAAGVWGISFMLNLRDMYAKPKKPASTSAKPAPAR
jgi:hypothetical protein